MVILVAWLLTVFVGFSYQMFLLGFAVKDRQWFERHGFSDDAQDIARGDVETEEALGIAHFAFLLVGVINYVINPVGPRPVTVIGTVMGVLFMVSPLVLIASSVRRQLRRDRVEKRSRNEALIAISELPATTE